MEELKKFEYRQKAVDDALIFFAEALEMLAEDEYDNKRYRHMRNSAIQSFEFSIDTFWKLLKDFLYHQYQVSVDNPTPKKVFREAVNVGFIDEATMTLFARMIDDRNITSHTYNEVLAEEIAQRLPEYYAVLVSLTQKIHL